MSSFITDPDTICAPHTAYAGNYVGYRDGYIYVGVTGTGTTWTSGTSWSFSSAPSGCSINSWNRISDTSGILEIIVGSTLGTITITDGASSTDLVVGAPSFVVSSPSSLPLNSTTYVYLTGTNTVWDSESGGSGRRNFTISGVSGCTLTDPSYSDATSPDPYWEDRAARLEITTGSTSGSLTIRDNPTGATRTIGVGGAVTGATAQLLPQITAYFTLARNSDFLTLNDPVRGEINNALYPLAGDTAYDITPDGFAIQVSRGRSSRVSDDIPPGAAVVQLRNLTRTYDPQYSGSPYVGNILPGKRIDLSLNYVTYFSGNVEDWDYSYDVDGNATASALVLDGLGSLARREFDEWTTTSQPPGARIGAVLDRDEVRWGSARDLDVGVSTLQADAVSWGSNVLNYLQLVARTDLGYFFASRLNVVTFRDRTNLQVTSVPFVLGLDVPFHGIEAQYGSETLFNRVGVDREGGTNQTVTDSDSADAYGVRSTSVSGLLLNSDSDSLDMAHYLLNKYKQPVWRVSSVTVRLHALDAYQLQLMTNLELADTIGISWTPNGVGDPIVSNCVIEGIDHVGAPMEHTMTLHLGDLDLFRIFILDDTTFGVLDSNSVSY